MPRFGGVFCCLGLRFGVFHIRDQSDLTGTSWCRLKPEPADSSARFWGSRVHATNDLQKRVALLRSPVHPDRLQAWALELDPRLQLKSFNRRIETLSQIHRNGLRPRGDGQLNARWTVRFVQISGVEIAGNNAAVSNSLYKQFQSGGLQKLWAPMTDGEDL